MDLELENSHRAAAMAGNTAGGSAAESSAAERACEEGATVATERCANCETELLGPHCYACGQPVQGMVRHFGSVLGDLFDTLLALDLRIIRTLWPLFTRPGFLTAEYFAGRRVRYVSPVRLFIFLCLTTFFVAQLSSDWSDWSHITFDDSDMARATSVEEVERMRDNSLAELEQARRNGAGVPGALAGLEQAERKVRQEAEERIAELSGETPAAEKPGDMQNCLWGRDGECWNPELDPIRIDAFPQVVNDWLTAEAVRADANVKVLWDDPNRFKKALFGAIPSTLFVLLPIFALMLWFLYLFKRRLYMEHLIVALHSHAFLCLALLLLTLLADMCAWLEEYTLVGRLYGWVSALLLLWMPLYLLLMQKRVYGQGWAMTLVKFCVLGVSYSVLLSLGASVAVFTSLARM